MKFLSKRSIMKNNIIKFILLLSCTIHQNSYSSQNDFFKAAAERSRYLKNLSEKEYTSLSREEKIDVDRFRQHERMRHASRVDANAYAGAGVGPQLPQHPMHPQSSSSDQKDQLTIERRNDLERLKNLYNAGKINSSAPRAGAWISSSSAAGAGVGPQLPQHPAFATTSYASDKADVDPTVSLGTPLPAGPKSLFKIRANTEKSTSKKSVGFADEIAMTQLDSNGETGHGNLATVPYSKADFPFTPLKTVPHSYSYMFQPTLNAQAKKNMEKFINSQEYYKAILTQRYNELLKKHQYAFEQDEDQICKKIAGEYNYYLTIMTENTPYSDTQETPAFRLNNLIIHKKELALNDNGRPYPRYTAHTSQYGTGKRILKTDVLSEEKKEEAQEQIFNKRRKLSSGSYSSNNQHTSDSDSDSDDESM